MSFHTRQSLAYVPPTAVFRTRNGRFVHQPVIAGGVRGLGDVSLAPSGIQNTAPGLPTIPTMKVENTRMRIAQEETLRLAPAGPGLPGSFVSSSALRDTTGRVTGARSGVVDGPREGAGVPGEVYASIYNALVEYKASLICCAREKSALGLVIARLGQLRQNQGGFFEKRSVRAALLALPEDVRGAVDRILERRGQQTLSGLIGQIDAGAYDGTPVSDGLAPGAGRGFPGTGSSGGTPGSGSLTSSLTRSRDFILRSSGDVAPAEQPTGAGMMPSLSAEEMDALRARAGLPPISSSDFMQGLTFGQIAGAAVGFAVGLGLLLLRRK